MRIGIPSEIKADEYRVALMPVGVELLVRAGHEVRIQSMAGRGSGFSDEAYQNAGALIAPTADEIVDASELIVKVKEPQPEEVASYKHGQAIFGYFHLAADPQLTQSCVDQGITAIAYETIRDCAGQLPLLTPMSEIAGKMSIQEGAKYLEKPMKGRGVLLGGVPGVAPAKVVVIGGGAVGTNAAKMAAGLGAQVVIMDVNIDRLRYLSDVMPANVITIYSDPYTVRKHINDADLVIGAVLIPGAKAPRIVAASDLQDMGDGAVVVDVAIDQGGCFETSRPTSHQNPTYEIDGVVHYCVTNMPGAVGRTSTIALCNATLPYIMRLASQGIEPAATADAGIAEGINIHGGRITHSAVANALKI